MEPPEHLDSPEQTLQYWQQTTLLVGTVLQAAPLEQARRPAYRLLIDLGPHGTCQSSAQITDRYTPDTLVGTQVVVVWGLPPKRVAGWRSDVLVLGLYTDDGVTLLRPDHPAPNGSRVG